MKNQLSIFILLISLFCAVPAQALGPFSTFFNQEWDASQSFQKTVEKNIEELQKRKAEATTQQNVVKALLDKTQKSIGSFKERAQRVRGTEQEAVTQELALANKKAQVLTETVQVFQDLKRTLDAHIKLLQEYKADPEFKNKGFQPEQKSIYSIDDFQKINGVLLSYQDELTSLEDRLKKITAEYDTLKKNQALARQELDEKRREQRELKTRDVTEERPERKKMTLKQRGELLDAEEQLLAARKDLADLKVLEVDQRGQFIEQSIKLVKLQLEVLETEAEQVRKELRVDKKDLALAQAALKNQIAESAKITEDYSKRIEAINSLRQTNLSQITELRQRFGIKDSDLEALYSWTYHPSSVADWNALIGVGHLYNNIVYLIDIHKERLQALIELEKAKVAEAEIHNLIIQSWYNLTTGKYDSYQEADTAKEIKQYEKIKADIASSISSLADKAATASNALTNNARVTEAIKAALRSFREQRDTVFKNDPEEYNRLGNLLKEEATTVAQERGEAIAQLVELYSTLVHSKELTIKKIDTMISVLSSKSKWKGGPQLWKGLLKFIPDMTKFGQYLFDSKQMSQSFTTNQKALIGWVGSFSSIPALALSIFLYAFILFLLYLLLRLYLPELAHFISGAIRSDYGLVYRLSSFLATVVSFVTHHLKGMYLWVLCFVAVWAGFLDTYLSVLFYLISIPIWIYYMHRFLMYLKAVNSARGYLFTSKRYQRRFFLVTSVFLYATVTILFLREALMAAFPKADAPHTLLALNFILLQISLILIIAREQVLSLVPRSTPLWEWVHDILNKYYYFFLAGIVFIIIMSNPYIGYGPTFFYAITRLSLIALLIPFFSALQNKIKQWSGSFFFYGDEEGIKERFRYGRTAYGLFIIASFICLTALALILAINVWGYPVGFEDLVSWLRKGIYSYIHPTTGRTIEVNAIALMKVLFYIVGGIFLAYFINRFVLKRMFELLLVNVGVQSAVLSLTRYAIILAAIIIGMSSIGLNYSLLYIFAVLGGLGVAGKELITDFIGYFVILVQRPLKIGDFVRIDPDLQGVVRHLTLRSIVMRKNNSVNVIIPNSFVMTRPVTNWNYSRTYFAFEDIMMTVIYAADPTFVKKLILDVLDKNSNILKNPAPIVRLNDFTDNGFVFLVRGFLSADKVLDQYDIASDVRLELVRTLRTHGLDVGSPTRVLKVVQELPKEGFLEKK